MDLIVCRHIYILCPHVRLRLRFPPRFKEEERKKAEEKASRVKQHHEAMRLHKVREEEAKLQAARQAYEVRMCDYAYRNVIVTVSMYAHIYFCSLIKLCPRHSWHLLFLLFSWVV